MKRFLQKRWHHLPIGIVTAVLVACLLAGGAFAAYQTYTATLETIVDEPIEVLTTTAEWTNPGPPEHMYAGDFYVGSWLIHNKGSNPLTITVRTSDSEYIRGGITIALSEEVGSLGPWDRYMSDGTVETDNDAIDTACVEAWANHYNEYTFTIGTEEYPIHAVADFEKDTSYIKLLAGFAVEEDAPTDLVIDWTITVSRG